MTQTSEELLKELKERRKYGNRRHPELHSDSGIGYASNATQGRTTSGGSSSEPAKSAEDRPSNSSSGSVQHSLSTVSRRIDGDQGHDSSTPNTERKLAGSAGSPAQNDRRTGPRTRRSSENNSTDRSDGINLRESLGSSEPTVTPILVGNLIRNVEEEHGTFIPPRTFTPEPAPPIVGQPALIIDKSGTPVKRATKGKQTDAARAVETIKAVIPKAKRGRPSSKSNPQNLLTEPEPAKLTIKDKIKEAGQAIPRGNKLTEKEIEELREPLQVALTDEFEMLDKLLWTYEGEQSIQQPIWSDINDPEMEKLVNALLNMGTRSATVATIARSSVDLSDYIIAGTLLAPRLQSTAQVVSRVRKAKKASRGRNR